MSSTVSSSLSIKNGPGAIPTWNLGFGSSRHLIGKFGSDGNGDYIEVSIEAATIPPLISQPQIQDLNGRFLGEGLDIPAEDRPEYHAAQHVLKCGRLFRWLSQSQYFQRVLTGEFKRPDFICYGSRIIETLKTPKVANLHRGWTLYASRYLDTIFLWDDRSAEEPRARQRFRSSFYGRAFEALLTGQDPGDVINDNNKVTMYNVEEIALGAHQLLLANEIDAMDEEGNWVEIKLTQEQPSRSGPPGHKYIAPDKYLSYWAQCAIIGAERLIIGIHDGNGELQRTDEAIEIAEVLKRTKSNMCAERCFQFQERLLAWVKMHFTVNDPKLVKRFKWDGVQKNGSGGSNTPNVLCSVVLDAELPGFTVPQWFVEASENQEP